MIDVTRPQPKYSVATYSSEYSDEAGFYRGVRMTPASDIAVEYPPWVEGKKQRADGVTRKSLAEIPESIRIKIIEDLMQGFP